jgi:nicotinic acid mononucleotide adenylyltransferase
MAGISHLYDLYNKKGKDFIEKLLNSYVTINEKMDGSAFVFDRDLQSGKFNFYKRDQRNPITLVDRTLMKYYEKPIQYIESLPPHILQKIPRGWKFGLEYFSNNQPVEIVYDRIPKNNLILSYIQARDENGKERMIQDKDELDNWADIIGVERPPIIFQGKLNEDQKEQIFNFLRTPFDQLVNEYKTRSFVAFIIGVLNPSLKSTALNLDLEKPIEGIVFRFDSGDGEGETILGKMVDPVFTEVAKSKAKKKIETKPSDVLGIAILDVMNFILERGVKSFNIEGDSEDNRYVSFISDVFYNFLKEYDHKYKNADFQEPDYLRKDEFRINRNLIDDKRVLHYIDKDESFESLYKLILNSFRKIRKRASGIITEGVLQQFNELVKEIESAVAVKKEKKTEVLQESQSIPHFLDFKKKNFSNKKVDYLTNEKDEETEQVEEKDDQFFSYKEFISALEKLDSSREAIMPSAISEESDPNKKLEPVNLLVGRFQPFHKGHMKMAQVLKEKNELPSVIAVVHPGHNKSGKSPFDEDLVSKYMEAVVRENPGLIRGFFIIPRGLLGVIYGAAKEHGFEVKKIGAGDDRISDYKKQEIYLKKHGSDFPEEIEVVETPRITSSTEVRKKLKEEDFLGFKKLVPASISSLYQSLASALNSYETEKA